MRRWPEVGGSPAVAVEVLKVRRSRLPVVSLAVFTLLAAVGALFMFILADVERARAMGLVGAKAQLVGGPATWEAYFALLAQMSAIGGLIVFGLVVVWVFGREFADGTFKDLLALPVSRRAIVVAKLAVSGGWCLVLGCYLFAAGLVAGWLLGLPGWSTAVLARGAGTVAATTLLTLGLTAAAGLAASVGRGYLPGVGALLAMVFSAQVIATLGYGRFFPWAVPALVSGMAGPDQSGTGVLGVLLVVAVTAAACWALVRWWERADHAR